MDYGLSLNFKRDVERYRHRRLAFDKLYLVQSLILATIIFCPPPCEAGDAVFEELHTPRFTLYIENTETDETDVGYEEPDEDRNQEIANTALEILNDNYEELSRIFSEKPQRKVVLRFLSAEEFHKQTGSPAWTSAMFYRGEITVPLPANGRMKPLQLERALRHEYVHAVTAELSGLRCPAWVDEGLAQLIEGKVNPVLGPSLRNWVEHDNPLPLSWLEDGFMTLHQDLVPVAYAQSLFAVRTLVNSKGFAGVRNYLKHLRDGQPNEIAFRLAFDRSQREFEMQLAAQIRRWAGSSAPHP